MNKMIKTIWVTILILIVIVLIITSFNKDLRAYDPTLVTTSTLDFANTAAGTSTDLTVSITGAADGDPVTIGIPNGSTLANGHFVAWVSAADVVTIRFLNNSLLAGLNPPSGTFKVLVHKK